MYYNQNNIQIDTHIQTHRHRSAQPHRIKRAHMNNMETLCIYEIFRTTKGD